MTNVHHTTTSTKSSGAQFDRFRNTSPCQLSFSGCIDETEVFTGIVDTADIDVEAEKMFESNEKRLKFLEQEVVRLSQALNAPVVAVGDSASKV